MLVGTDLVGTWRPRASGKKLTLTLEAWQRVPSTTRALVEEQAERLAQHREVTLTGVARG